MHDRLSIVSVLVASSLAGCASSGWHAAGGRTVLIERNENAAETACAARCRGAARPGETAKGCYDVDVRGDRRELRQLNGRTWLLACVFP